MDVLGQRPVRGIQNIILNLSVQSSRPNQDLDHRAFLSVRAPPLYAGSLQDPHSSQGLLLTTLEPTYVTGA